MVISLNMNDLSLSNFDFSLICHQINSGRNKAIFIREENPSIENIMVAQSHPVKMVVGWSYYFE
jgi:hypothetical protein